MRRREFITLVGGTALAWPLAARAQLAVMPVVGFLHAGFAEPNAKFVTAFRKGLAETGYVEAQNVAIEFRWAGGQLDRLPGMAADLVQRHVAVIAAPLGASAALAAKAATMTIPIVFATGGDPVTMGLVGSFNRPGGNITGISILSAQIGEKRFSLLRDLVPAARHFAVLGNPPNPVTQETVKGLQAAAKSLGLQLDVFDAGSDRDIDAAFAELTQKRTEALVIAPDEFFTSRIAKLAGLAVRNALPSAYVLREYAEAGGLMSYGTDIAEVFRQAGVYVGRILKREKPAELPVQEPNKFDFVINLKTAKALGITVTNSVRSVADDVIE